MSPLKVVNNTSGRSRGQLSEPPTTVRTQGFHSSKTSQDPTLEFVTGLFSFGKTKTVSWLVVSLSYTRILSRRPYKLKVELTRHRHQSLLSQTEGCESKETRSVS